MLRRAIVVAGLSAIAIAASGCTGDSDAEAEFRAAFEKEFSAAPWYQHITGMEVTEDERESGRPHIEVTTDLGPGDGETEGDFCGAVRDFAVDSGAYDEIPTVTVIGSDGVERGGCA
ncbi:MAG: hypothetical protein R6W48_04675 [Gaiellaceae bacterium]